MRPSSETFENPYFVTPHAVARYQERVDGAATAARVIDEIQAALQRPDRMADGRRGATLYGLHNSAGDEFCAVVMPPTDGRAWPQVVMVGEWWAFRELKSGWRERRTEQRRASEGVHWRMLHLPELDAYEERYGGIETQPLRVTCRLRPGGNTCGYDDPFLDNLLAWAVMREATNGAGLAGSQQAYALPLPLRCLWRDSEGLPLWAATQLRPQGLAEGDVTFYHKRPPEGRYTKTKSGRFAPTPQEGRWAERRIPTPCMVAQRWEAMCDGNAEEIARLLAGIPFIGKHRGAGHGEVEEWVVEPMDEFRLVEEGRFTRTMPRAAAEALGLPMPMGEAAPVGWTPPQWKPSLFADGWWARVEVHE